MIAAKVHPGPRARVCPEREPRVDLEQVEATVRSVLEVELGDALQVEGGAHLAAEPGDLRVVGDREGAGVPVH